MQQVFRQWRIIGDSVDIIVEEREESNMVGLVIESGEDVRRMWLTRSQFESLCDLKYAVTYIDNNQEEE